MLDVYVTDSASVSPMGTSSCELINSIIMNKNCLSEVPSNTFPTDFPVKFIGSLPGQTFDGFTESPISFQKNKKKWIEALFQNFLFQDEKIDLMIFTHNYSPNYYEFHLGKNEDFYSKPKFSINNEDFINFLCTKSNIFSSIQTVNIHNTCASSVAAISLAKDYIRADLAQSCLVIAYEISNHQRPLFISLNTLGALNSKARNINRASVPFSDDRAGFVKADAIGYVLVQNESAAMQSKRKPICSIRGSATTSDCHSLTDGIENGTMVEHTILKCLEDANLNKSAIEYINAHGSGTYLNDQIELLGINRLFSDQKNDIYLSSNKSQFGHALCATGIVEVDIINKMFQHDFIPPNLNYESSQEYKNIIIPTKSVLRHRVKMVLKNAFGFGGYNACVVFENIF